MDTLLQDLIAATRYAEQLEQCLGDLKRERGALREQLSRLEARLQRGAQAYEELNARYEAARLAKSVADPEAAAALRTQISTYITDIDQCLTLLGHRP